MTSFFNRDLVFYILSLFLFGLNGIVASQINLTSYEIVFYRTLLGSSFLFLIFYLGGGRMRLFSNRRHLLYMLISGLAMGISWMFLYEAYRQLGVGVATLTYCLGPMLLLLLSFPLFGEPLTRTKLLSFLVVLIGVFLVNSASLTGDRTLWGFFCGLMSALTFVFMVTFNRKASSFTGLRNVSLQVFVAFCTVATFVGLKQGLYIPISRKDGFFLLILGTVNTALACYLYFSRIGRLPAQSVAILSYLEPTSAVIFSALLLSDFLSPTQTIGALLVLGGALYAEVSGPKKVSPTLRTNRPAKKKG